jgi:hypothetical protein
MLSIRRLGASAEGRIIPPARATAWASSETAVNIKTVGPAIRRQYKLRPLRSRPIAQFRFFVDESPHKHSKCLAHLIAHGNLQAGVPIMLAGQSRWKMPSPGLMTVFALLAMIANAAAADFAGTFKDDHVTVVLQPGPAASPDVCQGTLAVNGSSYTIVARIENGSLHGTFADAQGNAFPFTAVMEHDRLVLSSGGTTYHLAPAGAAAAGAPAAPDNRDANRPAWLHEGAMICSTWFAMAVDSHLDKDPSGGWMDPATGKHFSPTEGQGMTAGGWSEALITCIDGDKVVLTTTGYSDMHLLGPRDPVPQGSGLRFIAEINSLDDYWMLPPKLAAQKSDAALGKVVTAGPWTYGGKTTDAIRIITVRAGAYVDHVYDRSNGLCIHAATRGVTEPARIVQIGVSRQGMTNYSEWNAVSIRDVSIPWAGMPMPDAVQTLRELHFSGSASFPSKPFAARPTGLTLDLQVTGRGNGWLTVGSALTMQFPGGQAFPPTRGISTYGHSQLHGLWIPPEGLAKLHEGQVIDEDPVTQMKTVVADANGATVTILSRSAGGELSAVYDRSTGLLQAITTFDGLTKQKSTLRRM